MEDSNFLMKPMKLEKLRKQLELEVKHQEEMKTVNLVNLVNLVKKGNFSTKLKKIFTFK